MSKVVKMTGEEFDPPASPEPDNYVVFRNKGEMDMRAVTIMGMSAKAKDNAIGYFGTGLKYAISILLRYEQEIVIYSGQKKYTFKRKAANFRGKEFDVIMMNNKELPFTTEYGRNWKMWQAFRELWCNTVDEDGEVTQSHTAPRPANGYTYIIVKGKSFQEVYNDRGMYILLSEPFLKDEEVEVHNGASHSIFYRGIKVHDCRHTLYTYNIVGNMELTEDRTVQYFWHPRMRIMRCVLRSNDAEFIRTVLTAPEGSYEAEFDFTDNSEATIPPGETFIEVARELEVRKSGEFNRSAFAKVKDYLHSTRSGEPKPVSNLSRLQQAQFDRAKEFCNRMGFDVDAYQIVVTDDMGFSTLGLAEGGKIFVSVRAFSMGVKKLAGVMIEEYLHLRKGFADESREFQNYLLEKIVDIGEELTGEPL